MIVEDNELSLNSDVYLGNIAETQNENNQLSASSQLSINPTMPDLLDNTITLINGVRFINAQELSFVQTHRSKFPNISWNPHNNLESTKPSPNWFSKDHPWLRAVCKDGSYGLLCVDCAEFASSEMAIKRNNGAFIVRPYWKLKHKGLEGKKPIYMIKFFIVSLLIRNSRT